MALNATTRKKLNALLDSQSRSKIGDDKVEEAAAKLLDGKKTIAELAEQLQVSTQTLKKRLRQIAEDPAQQVEA